MADVMVEKTEESFRSGWLTDFFHSFPHYNLRFERVNSTFDPEVKSYREALFLWAVLPLVICCLFWIVFTIYFIVRCCQRPRSAKTNGSACPKVFTGIMVFFAICLLGVSFYENEETHEGVERVRHSALKINTTLESASDTINILDDIATDVSDHLTSSLAEIFSQVPNATIQAELLKQVNNIRKRSSEVHGYLDGFEIRKPSDEFDQFITTSDDYEYYRWLITIIILCVYIFIFLVTFVGLVVRSFKLLIVSTVVIIICSVLIWTSCGAYLASSVALGDFCDDPDTYVLSFADRPEKEVMTAYVKCTDPQKPYEQNIMSAQQAVIKATEILNSTMKIAKPYQLPGLDELDAEMNLQFQNSMGNLSDLLQSVGMCPNIHGLYISALNGACDKTFKSAALLSALSFVIAMCCVILIISASCVWRQYRKHRPRLQYEPVDDTDPFLPRPPPYEPDYGATRYSSPTPWSERGTLQHTPGPSTQQEDGVMMLPSHYPVDDSPPPAYHSGRFVQRYADSQPT